MEKFTKGNKHYRGVCFNDAEQFKNDAEIEFAGVLYDDINMFQQIRLNLPSGTLPLVQNERGQFLTSKKVAERSIVGIVREGTPDAYIQTLYVFPRDWLMWCVEDNRLMVVDEEKIQLFQNT